MKIDSIEQSRRTIVAPSASVGGASSVMKPITILILATSKNYEKRFEIRVRDSLQRDGSGFSLRSRLFWT